MYSNNDFERLFFRYKAEGLPHNESIQHFCDRQGVPYNLFDKWYRDTRSKLVPVQVNGRPVDAETDKDVATEQPEAPKTEKETKDKGVRIMVSIKMTNGIHISQRNLDYNGLRTLVERLEGLC